MWCEINILGYVHTCRLFWSCQRLFYIIILWSKPCFQKSPERFLKRHRRRLFLQLRASFQVEKSWTFLEKTPYVKRLFDSWPMTSEWRVISITTKTTRKNKVASRQIVLVSEHKELYETVHHPTGAPGLNKRCEPTLPSPLTSKSRHFCSTQR